MGWFINEAKLFKLNSILEQLQGEKVNEKGISCLYLLKKCNIPSQKAINSKNKRYIEKVNRYIVEILPLLSPANLKISFFYFTFSSMER